MTPPDRPPLLRLGRTWHAGVVAVIGSTPTRYRVRALVRLRNGDRVIEPGETTSVARNKIRFFPPQARQAHRSPERAP